MVYSWRALHVNLLKMALRQGIVQVISPQLKNSDIEKCSFVLEIFLNGCFSKAIAKIYLLILMVYKLYISKYEVMVTLFRMGGPKRPPTGFSHVTSTNIGIGP